MAIFALARFACTMHTYSQTAPLWVGARRYFTSKSCIPKRHLSGLVFEGISLMKVAYDEIFWYSLKLISNDAKRLETVFYLIKRSVKIFGFIYSDRDTQFWLWEKVLRKCSTILYPTSILAKAVAYVMKFSDIDQNSILIISACFKYSFKTKTE
jgi:hypothetical protein